MDRKNRNRSLRDLLLTGIIGFSLVLMMWSINSLAQTGGTPSKSPSEIYRERLTLLNKVYAKEYLSLAKWCKTKKLFDQAEENFKLVLKCDPENKQARKQIEKGFPKSIRPLRNIERLLAQYDRELVALHKKLADQHYALGVWCKQNALDSWGRQTNLPDKADKEFDRAIKLCFDHKKTRKELGQVKVKGFGWVDKEIAAKLKKGLREYKGKWLPKRKVEKLRQNWEDAWEIKTRHYLIRTNNTYEQGYKIGQVLEDLYQMYFQVLGKVLKLKEPEGLLSVYYFRSEDEYKTEFQRIHSKPPPGPIGHIGYYESSRKTVYLWGQMKVAGQDEKDTARHECTHQLNDLAAGGRSGSWLEEGLAAYFESVRRNRNGRLTVGDIKSPRYGGDIYGQVSGFPIAIQKGEVIELKRFLQLEVNKMYSIKYSYEQGASLVRFFLTSKPGQRYKDRFLKFVWMCYTVPVSPKTGQREIDSLKAFQKCFPKVDLDELEKDFLAGWDK